MGRFLNARFPLYAGLAVERRSGRVTARVVAEHLGDEGLLSVAHGEGVAVRGRRGAAEAGAAEAEGAVGAVGAVALELVEGDRGGVADEVRDVRLVEVRVAEAGLLLGGRCPVALVPLVNLRQTTGTHTHTYSPPASALSSSL